MASIPPGEIISPHYESEIPGSTSQDMHSVHSQSMLSLRTHSSKFPMERELKLASDKSATKIPLMKDKILIQSLSRSSMTIAPEHPRKTVQAWNIQNHPLQLSIQQDNSDVNFGNVMARTHIRLPEDVTALAEKENNKENDNKEIKKTVSKTYNTIKDLISSKFRKDTPEILNELNNAFVPQDTSGAQVQPPENTIESSRALYTPASIDNLQMQSRQTSSSIAQSNLNQMQNRNVSQHHLQNASFQPKPSEIMIATDSDDGGFVSRSRMPQAVSQLSVHTAKGLMNDYKPMALNSSHTIGAPSVDNSHPAENSLLLAKNIASNSNAKVPLQNNRFQHDLKANDVRPAYVHPRSMKNLQLSSQESQNPTQYQIQMDVRNQRTHTHNSDRDKPKPVASLESNLETRTSTMDSDHHCVMYLKDQKLAKENHTESLMSESISSMTPPLPPLSPNGWLNSTGQKHHTTKSSSGTKQEQNIKKHLFGLDQDQMSTTTRSLDLESLLGTAWGREQSASDSEIDTQGIRNIRTQLESLEHMYSEVLRMLGSHSMRNETPLRIARRHGSLSSLPSSSVSNRPIRDKSKCDDRQKVRDIKGINKRFQRLESHVVTLARSVAHLSSEMTSQHVFVQEIERLREDLNALRSQTMRQQHIADNSKTNTQSSNLTNPKRVQKLKNFFGEDPPLIRLFLKKLGYEKYIELFENERIGMVELPYLSEERLQKLGVPMGPRLRILQEAQISLCKDATLCIV